MKMKKKILLFVVVTMLIVMLLVLTGCGNSTKEDNNTAKEEESSVTNNDVTDDKKESSTSSKIKLNAGYRYTEEDGFGYSQIDLYDDNSVVLTNVETEKGVMQQCYGKYTIDGKNLTVKLSEEYSFRSEKRISFPDGDWYFTIESDKEIKSERVQAGVKGRIYTYVDSMEKILD